MKTDQPLEQVEYGGSRLLARPDPMKPTSYRQPATGHNQENQTCYEL